jgi:hypothetical protein
MNRNRVKILHVFENYLNVYNVVIIIKDDKSDGFSINSFNNLCFGHSLQTMCRYLNVLEWVLNVLNILNTCLHNGYSQTIHCH